MEDFFNLVFIHPIINILVALYSVFSLIHLPYALGFAIIGLTIVIRLIIYPLTTSQLRASLKMQKIGPHLSRLKEKHKGDSARIQQETLRLYKEHGVNPAAGCLPIIIQMPIFFALYSVLQRIVSIKPDVVVSEINKIVYSQFGFLKLNSAWETSFFGFPLGGMPSQLLSTMPLILLIPVATGVLQFILSKMMIPAKSAVVIEKNIEKKGNVDKKDASDFANAFQTQAMYIFPVMIGFFSFSFPIGLSLYWNTFTIFGIIQQYKIVGLGGLSEWIKKR